MDPIPIKILKFQAINKHKKHQTEPLINLFFYCLAALTCCLFCSSPLWFPSFVSSMKGFFLSFVHMMSSVFLSSKFVFILGNLIVVALVGESKIFSTVSPAPNIHVEYEENIKRCQRFQPSSTYKEKEPEKVNCDVEERVVLNNSLVDERVLLKMSSCGDGDQAIEGKGCKELRKGLVVDEVKDDIDDEDEELSLPEEEQFNKRADDFIARVNERRRYELLLATL
ncbi:hypothetical protein ACLB2K_044067 [Fragaria x ananassa]|uniref:uncharacterized protein LOC105351186 n=1 Tax=Fragaria vesca subsp. vesca TaxID=101020 RepID=UPI0005CA5FA5|nr:PREDICTED: uncharacterized protein LOC105351186 [Fragaria vesca subsp. vesca]